MCLICSVGSSEILLGRMLCTYKDKITSDFPTAQRTFNDDEDFQSGNEIVFLPSMSSIFRWNIPRSCSLVKSLLIYSFAEVGMAGA